MVLLVECSVRRPTAHMPEERIFSAHAHEIPSISTASVSAARNDGWRFGNGEPVASAASIQREQRAHSVFHCFLSLRFIPIRRRRRRRSVPSFSLFSHSILRRRVNDSYRFTWALVCVCVFVRMWNEYMQCRLRSPYMAMVVKVHRVVRATPPIQANSYSQLSVVLVRLALSLSLSFWPAHLQDTYTNEHILHDSVNMISINASIIWRACKPKFIAVCVLA